VGFEVFKTCFEFAQHSCGIPAESEKIAFQVLPCGGPALVKHQAVMSRIGNCRTLAVASDMGGDQLSIVMNEYGISGDLQAYRETGIT